MSIEENKAIVRKFTEAVNERNLDSLGELIKLNYIDHTHHLQGLEECKKLAR